MMKPRLLALLFACALPVMVAGQEVLCTPFDNNGDNIVGIGDLIDLLARFGDSDLDQDGIWDSADDCVGAYDTCGVCNGPGPQVLAIDTIVITFDSIYVDTIDEWLTYELSRDTLLHLVCENPGCTDPIADNFDPYAEEGGLCTYGGPCLGPTFDNYTYDAVLIGDQCWFAENLRVSKYSDGSNIPSLLTEDEWRTTNLGAMCSMYNDAVNYQVYGSMYNWYAVNDARGLCPSGWHVPSNEDWEDLTNYVVLNGFLTNAVGDALKASSGWGGDGNGTDDFEFSAIPGGVRYGNSGDFGSLLTAAYFWTSTQDFEYVNPHAMAKYLWSYGEELYTVGAWRAETGCYIRCLRDSE